jgi:hypothetical protein
MRYRAGGHRCLAGLLVFAFLIGVPNVRVAGATTQVDCITPDEFCTGNPCTTTDRLEITVSSCVLDFGSRALVLATGVTVPSGGTLSLTAGSIEVKKKINGQHTGASDGDGADISLSATGSIVVGGRIVASGSNSSGTISLNAGGNVDLNAQLASKAKGGGSATGGSVNIHAGNQVITVRKGKIDVRGKGSAGGQVSVAGASGVMLEGKTDLRGEPAGSVVVDSSAGDVVVGKVIKGDGGAAAVTLTAGGNLTTQVISVKGGGASAGGTIALTAGTAGAVLTDNLRADGNTVAGGNVSITGGSVQTKTIKVRGSAGGTVDIKSLSGDVSVTNVEGEGSSGAGGTVTIDAASAVNVPDGLQLNSPIAGGAARITAGGNASLGETFGKQFDVSGSAGGVIAVHATGNLTAMGQFTAASGGCIGLSAGGVLDTTGATFDVPLTASCP